jgi:hypothetical protein
MSLLMLPFFFNFAFFLQLFSENPIFWVSILTLLPGK